MTFEKVLNNRFLVLILFPFLLGAVSVLSFQPFNFLFINFFSLSLLFLILTYVRKKIKKTYRKKPYLLNFFIIGYAFGFGFFLLNLFWISYSLTYVDEFKFLIPFSIILIPLMLAIFFGVGTLIVGPILKNDVQSLLIFCSTFAVIDYLRGKIFTGFPWNLWAYSWSSILEKLQILNFLGLYAFNLFAITIFCTLALFFFKKNKLNYLFIIFLLLSSFGNYIYGSYEMNKDLQKLSDKEILIKIVSPSTVLNYNIEIDELTNQIKEMIKFSDPKENKKTIFIWPEGVFSGYNFSDLKHLKKTFRENFSKNHIIVFGANTYKKELNKDIYYNSLIAVNNEFEVIYKYNKRKLVPFGEFLPFENILNKIGLKKITRGYGSFTKGNVQKNFSIENAKILPLICYEIIFPELIQNSNKNTNLIINISEDAWFGDSIGPKQHFTKAIFRAIENNTYLVRSTNKGISGFVDNKGRVIKSLNPNETGNIELKVPLIENNKKNKNDLIFFILLFTYTIIFFTKKNKL